MTTLQDIETRAEKWALQTSTIIGAATIAAAAVGSGVDATTGMPWLSALIGLLVGGATAILLPGQNPAPLVAATAELTSTIASHKADIDKASDAAVIATATLQQVAPKIEAQVQQVAAKVDAISPVLQAAVAAAGKPGIAAVIGEAGTVLSAIEGGKPAV